MNNSTEIKVLKQTLNLNILNRLAYEKLLVITDNNELKEWLEFKIETLSDFIFDLTIELNTKGIIYNRSLKTSFKKLIYSFKYLTLNNNEKNLISESLKLDATLREKLSNKIKNESLSEDTKSIIKKEISSITNFNVPSMISTLQLQ